MGAGPLAADLSARAQHDPRIILPGHVDAQTRSDYLAVADIFVLPSHHDPWGLVVNEAMHMGLPVIVTEAAAAHEMVGEAGVVIPPGDGERLSETLRRLFNDTHLRQKMAAQSRPIVRDYSTQRAVDGFLSVLRLAGIETRV